MSEKIKQNAKQGDLQCLKTAIDECAKSISNVFIEGARFSLKAKRQNSLIKRKRNKMWFNLECVKMKKRSEVFT